MIILHDFRDNEILINRKLIVRISFTEDHCGNSLNMPASASLKVDTWESPVCWANGELENLSKGNRVFLIYKWVYWKSSIFPCSLHQTWVLASIISFFPWWECEMLLSFSIFVWHFADLVLSCCSETELWTERLRWTVLMAWSMRQGSILMAIHFKRIKDHYKTVCMQEIPLLVATA